MVQVIHRDETEIRVVPAAFMTILINFLGTDNCISKV